MSTDLFHFNHYCTTKPVNDVIMFMLKNKRNIIEILAVDTVKSYGLHYIGDIKTIPYLANIGYYKEVYGINKYYPEFMFIFEFIFIFDTEYKHKFVL